MNMMSICNIKIFGAAMSACPDVPLKMQKLRKSQINLPSGMDPGLFIGKGGTFMKELKAKCCIADVGIHFLYIIILSALN